MSCYSCGGNPNTFCRDCTYPKDTWIAPVDKLPDTFMGDFDHLFRTPDGNLYALSPDRTRWIRVNGEAGNSASYNDTELKKRITALEGRTDNFVSGIGVSREGGKVKLTYTFIDGTHKEVEFEDKDTKSIAYDDSALKARVKALEDKPAPTIKQEPVHRFYNGDIPGRAETDTVKTVPKSGFRNPDDIKVGDTVEDYWVDNNSINRGIWKVTEVSGNNVKVQGIGNYDANLRRNLSFDNNTRVLSIDGGNNVTIPSDKQTISKQGNKLILSNGGGEVDLPQPNNAVAYDDKPLRDRVTALEGRRDNDNQTLTLNDRTLSISNGNSVTLPSDKQTISKQGNRLVLSNGGGEIDLPTPKDSVPYDDTALRNRVKALEDRPDRDNQTLSLDGDKLKLTNGGEVNLEKYDTPVSRYTKRNISTQAVVGAESVLPLDLIINKDRVKPGDVIQDIVDDPDYSGKIHFNYWQVSEIRGNNAFISFIGEYETHGYLGDLNNRVDALEKRPTPTNQRLSLSGNTLSLTDGGSVTLPQGTVYNDADVKRRLTELESRTDTNTVFRISKNDIPGGSVGTTVTIQKSTLFNPDDVKVGDIVQDYFSSSSKTNTEFYKVTAVNGNNVTVENLGGWALRNDKQTISKNGNKIVLSDGGGEVDIPTATPYNDADIKRRLGVLEAKPDNDKQTLSISGNTLSISNGNSVNIPQPNLSGYVPIDEYNKLKGALEKLLTDLKGSGAWRQTGATVFEGSLDPNRHLATGNINLFGGATDGSSFIRTNNGSTENDLAGGIG